MIWSVISNHTALIAIPNICVNLEKICNVSIVEANEVTSGKLGLPNASSECATCGSRNIRDCDGEFI
ncbi:hypothetical protein BHE74_00021197 [Ensete ventricosum]|nr:hypothetical protein GW17_00038538 [Ensete ventricosum]RWW71085.1 hypothetical protein BHE74_00021197 [Ensete ventricosum]